MCTLFQKHLRHIIATVIELQKTTKNNIDWNFILETIPFYDLSANFKKSITVTWGQAPLRRK